MPSLEINIFEINHISLICLEFFILKFTEPLQSYCCPVQKNLPRKAELARQVSRYLWRGSVDFKKKSRPFFIIIFKLKNGNFKTRDFSPLAERVLAGVMSFFECVSKPCRLYSLIIHRSNKNTSGSLFTSFFWPSQMCLLLINIDIDMNI